MNWYLYKKDDPNTWPQIDCPMIVYYPYKQYHDSEEIIFKCKWDSDRKQFYTPKKWWDEKELYYAYVAYVPSGYKTCHPTKCTKGNCCDDGYDDDGYCLDYDDNCACGYKKAVAEYSIEAKAIWKEFD